MLAAGEDRRLVADVGQVGTGQAAGLAGDEVQVHVLGERLVARVHVEDLAAALEVGRRDEDLPVEAAGAQQRRVELVEQVGGGDHDDLVAAAKPSSSTSSWLSVWSFSPEMSLPRVAPTASSSSMKMIAGRLLARLAEQPPDARRAEAGEHLDERGRRLGEELGVRLVGHRLGEQRLAGAGRPVQQDALRHLRAELAEALRVAQELHDLAQLVLRLLDAGHVLPPRPTAEVGLDLLRLGARHEAQHCQTADQRSAHEDDRQPDDRPVLDVVPGEAAARAGRRRTAGTLNESLPSRGRTGWPRRSASRRAAAARGGEDLAERLARAVAGEIARLHGDRYRPSAAQVETRWVPVRLTVCGIERPRCASAGGAAHSSTAKAHRRVAPDLFTNRIGLLDYESQSTRSSRGLELKRRPTFAAGRPSTVPRLR